MKPLLLLVVFAGSSWCQTCTPATGYSFCLPLVQHHLQNGSSDSANFPVGVIGIADGTGTAGTSATNSFFGSTVADFRTVGNGGRIQNTTTQPTNGLTVPADFIVTDCAGTTLNFEITYYVASTGQIDGLAGNSLNNLSQATTT